MEWRQQQTGRSPEAYQRGEHSLCLATATCARERNRSALASQHNTGDPRNWQGRHQRTQLRCPAGAMAGNKTGAKLGQGAKPQPNPKKGAENKVGPGPLGVLRPPALAHSPEG